MSFLSPVQLDRTQHVCPSQNISLCRLIDGKIGIRRRSDVRCSRGWRTNTKVNYLNVFCCFLCVCLCLHRVYRHFYRKLIILHAGNISTFTLDNIFILLSTDTCILILASRPVCTPFHPWPQTKILLCKENLPPYKQKPAGDVNYANANFNVKYLLNRNFFRLVRWITQA